MKYDNYNIKKRENMTEEQAENTQVQEEQVTENVESVNQEGVQAAETSHDDKDRNIYEMRKRLEQEQREKEELQRKHDEAMRLMQQAEAQKQGPPKPEPEDDWNFGEDEDLAEVKHLKKMAAALKKQQKEFEEYKQRSTASTAEARLRAQFPDLEKVVSQENQNRLAKEDPELYQSLLHNPDPYSQYAAAYRAIKRYGIYKEDKYVKEKQKAQENTNKPRPLTSVSPQQGDSPLSRANAFANGLTEDLKKQLWKEMQESSKRS